MQRRLSHVAVTGRFQPFHCDHLDLLRHGFTLADNVIVAITNPDLSNLVEHPSNSHRHRRDANPYSFDERRTMIDRALCRDEQFAGRYSIVACDLENPASWAQVFPPATTQLVRVFGPWEHEKVRRFQATGCAVIVLAGDAATRIAASDIRAAMRSGAAWQHLVPDGTRDWLLARERRRA